MSLYKPSLDVMVESINRLNKLDLVASEYIFEAPIAITPVGQFNTTIVLTAKNQETAYSGSETFRYHRNPLSDLAAQVTLMVPVKEPQSTSDIIAAMNKRYGTLLTDKDVLIRALTDEEKVHNAVVELEALPTSLAWTGTVSVGTRPGGYQLADYLKVTRLNGLRYPAATTTRPYAQIYSYWRDFTTSYEQLKDIVVGDAPLEVLGPLLKTQTGDDWKTEGISRFSLAGATIRMVGICADHPTEANPKYDRFIKVVLVDANCLGMTGELTLHFNEPDPDLA